MKLYRARYNAEEEILSKYRSFRRRPFITCYHTAEARAELPHRQSGCAHDAISFPRTCSHIVLRLQPLSHTSASFEGDTSAAAFASREAALFTPEARAHYHHDARRWPLSLLLQRVIGRCRYRLLSQHGQFPPAFHAHLAHIVASLVAHAATSAPSPLHSSGTFRRAGPRKDFPMPSRGDDYTDDESR